MKKLNGREYFIIVIIAIITIVLSILLGRELFSQTSPFITSSEGELVNMREQFIINIGQTLIHLVLSLVAFIFLLMKRRAGWIAAFSILTLYTLLGLYVAGTAIFAGLFGPMVIIGLVISLSFLLALLFLCVPSTIKKFNITKTAIIPVVLILALESAFAFFSTGY